MNNRQTSFVAPVTVPEIPTLPSAVFEYLLVRGNNPSRPALENRVAFQWEQEGDVLGYYNGSMKNRITLEWLAESVEEKVESRTLKVEGGRGKAVLDVGCAYGNMLLMLNARLSHPQNVRLVGIDLHPEGMQFAGTFAEYVPGYSNCMFQVANLTNGLPFADATFDAVNLGDVLEHMDDPNAALKELIRVMKPGAALLISTPLRESMFKRFAAFCNRLSRGRLNRAYYDGKNTQLNDDGLPIMRVHVGNDHVSEMTFPELRALIRDCGLEIEKMEMMPIMSGGKWFDRHPFLLAALMALEALHRTFRFPSWSHSVCLLARLPKVRSTS